MIPSHPLADSGRAAQRLVGNPPPNPEHPLQCFLNQSAADPCRVMSHPRERGTGAAGSRAGSDAMPLGWAPNMHVNACPTVRVQSNAEGRVNDRAHEPADHLRCSPRCVFIFNADLNLTSLFLADTLHKSVHFQQPVLTCTTSTRH